MVSVRMNNNNPTYTYSKGIAIILVILAHNLDLLNANILIIIISWNVSF